MSFFRTAYDTSIGSSLNTKPTVHALKESFIKEANYNTNLDVITSQNYRSVFITGYYGTESDIPFFSHPLVIENFKGQNFLVTDIRPFIKIDHEKGGPEDFNIRNQTEFNVVKSRAILNLAWLEGNQNRLKNDLSFAGNVFGSWLSETISKRFALDPRDQLMLFIISHFYYQSLFFEESEFDEDTLQKFAIHTIKATKAPSAMVFEIFDRIGKLSSIHDYCENVKNILENVRLKDLNPGLLVTVIGNSWFGMNSKEILAIALEHPPTWVSLVYASMVERTFRNSTIARISERFAKNRVGDDFLKAYSGLVGSFIDDEKYKQPTFNTF